MAINRIIPGKILYDLLQNKVKKNLIQMKYNRKLTLLISLGGVVLGLFAWAVYAAFFRTSSVPAIHSFDECVKAGNPVLESFPEQCKTPDGQTFTADDSSATISISSYEDCVNAGYPSSESNPPQCTTPDGKTFTQRNLAD